MTPTGIDAVEARAAAAGGAGKRAFVRRLFSEIAPRYDLLNHLLSFNIDRRWRRLAVQELVWWDCPAGTYIDLCAGTLDVAGELARQPRFQGLVLGTDFVERMLQQGLHKAPLTSLAPVVADALALPLPDGVAAGAIVAFGARNLADLDAGLAEVYRVLVPGARFVILEFSTPRNRLVRAAYHAYFHHLLPAIGGLVSGNGAAYRYLPESVATFPEEETLANRMREAGFRHVRWCSLTFGVAAIHVGEKDVPDRIPGPGRQAAHA
jgi:demethylmenaquinone methyltransferase / 2-methoxy-6-polyprenyl-1,4-benzoquinol methylase